jgi:hypothetical protein
MLRQEARMVSLPDLARPFDADDAAAHLEMLGLSLCSVWWRIETLAPFDADCATAPHFVMTNALGAPMAAGLDIPPPSRLAAWVGYGYQLFGIEVDATPSEPPTSGISLQRVERAAAFLPLLHCGGLYKDRTAAILATLFAVYPADAQGGALLTARPGPLPPDMRVVGLPPAPDDHALKRVGHAWTLLTTFVRETRGRRRGRDVSYDDIYTAYRDWVDDAPGARLPHCPEKSRPSQPDLAAKLATSPATIGRVCKSDGRGWPPRHL